MESAYQASPMWSYTLIYLRSYI